jgi:exosortase
VRTHVTIALALIAGAAVFAPTLAWLAESWRVHPYYSHGFVLPLVAAWFAWRGWTRRAPDDGSDAGLLLVAAGIGLHALAMRDAAYPLSAAGMLLSLLGAAMLVGGRQGARAVAFPIAVLALAIPLPMVERLAPPLAAGVAHAAAGAVSVAGVGVSQSGAQLAVGDGAFVVGAPCSGLRSLVALGTVAVVFAGALEGPVPRRLLLVALALPLALAANWARLAGLLWAADAYGTDEGLQLFHAMSGPVPFFLAIAGLVAAGRALGCDIRSHVE